MSAMQFNDDGESDGEDFNPQPGYGSDDDVETTARKPATEQDKGAPSKRSHDNNEDERDEGADEEADQDDDEDAEEENDDDDEDDDDDEAVSRPKKRRKERRNQFLDVEAEVDDEDEELDDEDDDPAQNEFVADTHPDDEGLGEADRDDRRHRELDRQRNIAMELDAEEQAKRFKERYGRNRAANAGADIIPQRLLLPSVNDPSIYGVRVKPGKEKEVLQAINKRIVDRVNSRDPLRIAAAFERGSTSMTGYLYVEAQNQGDVLHAVDGISNCYPRTNMVLVPIAERPDLLRVHKSKTLEAGQYVRMKRPAKYQGDLAQVEAVDANGIDIEVKIVPREDYGLTDDANAPTLDAAAAAKRKRATAFGRGALLNRPPPRLFNEHEAKKRNARNLAQTSHFGKKEFIYMNQTYSNGFLMLPTRVSNVQTDVQPTLEEVSLFTQSSDDGAENLDLASLAQAMKAASGAADYLPGDAVEIYQGEQKGVAGTVSTAHGEIVSIRVTSGELTGTIIEAPSKTLRKRFREGDHVRVVGASKYQDEIGMIIKIRDDRVTLLSDATQTELTVFSKDLRLASETTVNTTGSKYDLHDLIQLDPSTVAVVVKVDRESLRALDQHGEVRTILPSQVTAKHERAKFAVATDREGSEIRQDDTVREIGGEQRSGQIRHIHRQYLFCHNRQRTENSGIFVTRTTNVVTVAAKGGRVQNGPDLTKMNPALQRPGAANAGMAPPPRPQVGRDRLIGKTVKIRKGDKKGSLGRVKDTTATHARVEMSTFSKIMQFPKDILVVVDPITGKPLPDGQRFGAGASAGGFNRGPPAFNSGASRVPTGAMDGSRTPAAVSNGSKTPGWAAGNKTPAWGRGPSSGGGFGGGRTPMAASGGMTAYGGGNRTSYGGATAYGGATSYGGSTSYGGYSGGASTPYGGYGAPTPGASGDQPTPGYGITPAASAATPGVYGAPTPGVEDDGYE